MIFLLPSPGKSGRPVFAPATAAVVLMCGVLFRFSSG
jgi:hypothetical protein